MRRSCRMRLASLLTFVLGVLWWTAIPQADAASTVTVRIRIDQIHADAR